VVEEFSTFPLTANDIMKLFASKFYQTLVFNVATIAAIVVGLYQFAVRAFNENNGSEKVRKLIQTVLQFVNTIVSYLEVYFQDPAPVTVARVSTKRTKRA